MKLTNVKGTNRGHQIKLDDSMLDESEKNITLLEYKEKYGITKWVYCDTLEQINEDRPCAKCNAIFKRNTPDPCFGYLEHVTGACCGHGVEGKTYINVEMNIDLTEYQPKKSEISELEYEILYRNKKNFLQLKSLEEYYDFINKLKIHEK